MRLWSEDLGWFRRQRQRHRSGYVLVPKISRAPATMQAYSILPNTFGLTTFPAIRTPKTSPNPRSKMISIGARESIQLSTTASGCWDSEDCDTARLKSRTILSPCRKRLLPSKENSKLRRIHLLLDFASRDFLKMKLIT